MERLAIARILTLGILIASAQGFSFNSAKDYDNRITWEASALESVTAEDSPKKEHSDKEPRPQFACPRDGQYPYPADCKRYVECSGGQSHLVDCPKYLHFSPRTQRCESPCIALCDPNVDCEWMSPMSSKRQMTPQFTSDCSRDGLYPNPDACTSYIHCSNGRKYVMPCPRGLHFSAEHQICESPCEAHCDPTMAEECRWHQTPSNDFDICKRPPSRGPCNYNVTRYYFDRREGVCKTFVYGGCRSNGNNFKTERECSFKCLRRSGYSLKQSAAEFKCSDDGLYPNAEDCSTYIQCSDGQSYVMPCPAGKHFNRESGVCDDRCEAHCDPSLVTECDWSDSSVDSIKRKIVLQPGFQYIEDGLYPDRHDCTRYKQCSLSRCYPMACPWGLHFSYEAQTCLDPCDAHCDPSLEYHCHWESGWFLLKKDWAGPRCEEDGTHPNPEDCETYIRCTGKKDYVVRCPDGKHFSKSTLRCEKPCDAKCDTDLAEECKWEEDEKNTLLKQPVFDFSCLSNGLFENEYDCASFIQCTGGSAYLISCPVGQHYNPRTKKCESPCSARCLNFTDEECQESSTIPSFDSSSSSAINPAYSVPLYHDYVCNEDGLNPDTTNCSKYIQCSGGHSYVMNCPTGFHFNPRSQECDSPCEAKCDPAAATRCSWKLKDYSTRKPEYDFACEKEGPFQDPGDCSRYVACSEGQAYSVPCPRGLHFNLDTKRCESPCEAECEPSFADTCGWDKPDIDFPTYKGTIEIDCEDEPDAGPCKENIIRYYYDADSGRCSKFVYGGCGGNSNNFYTEAECRQKCQQKQLGGFRCPVNNGWFGHHSDCVSYYECKRGNPTLKKCPVGKAFDYLKQKCVTEHEASCLYQCRDPDAVYPYEADSRRYIDCVNGVSKLEKCPPGTVFDADESNCVKVNVDQYPWG